jgi:hypothetical protein
MQRLCSKRPKIRSCPISTAGRPGAALQAQLFYPAEPPPQQISLRRETSSRRRRSRITCSIATRYLPILNLDDNELFIYQRLYEPAGQGHLDA